MSECMEGTHQHVDVCNRVGRRLALAELEERLPEGDGLITWATVRALIEEVRRG